MSGTTASINYPDILGVITGNNRLNINVIQCALSTRPDRIHAGQHFEVLLLIQNVADVNIDVTVELVLPDRDAAGKKNMFFSKSSRLLVGLEPAEAGFMILPIFCSPKAQPGKGYRVGMNIKVNRMEGHSDKNPNRVRAVKGGGAVNFGQLSEEVRRHMLLLRALSWETHARGASYIEATFEVLPTSLGTLTETNAGWVSLWTIRDYENDVQLQQLAQEHLNIFLPNLHRNIMFKPLLEATQTWFTKAGYPLHPAEAIHITKLLTLLLCEEFKPPKDHENTDQTTLPRWYKSLLRLLFQEHRFSKYPITVITETLYPDLVYDGVLFGFQTLEANLHENFGSAQEKVAYAEDIYNAMMNSKPLSYAQVYLPLVMAGGIVSSRIMQRGQNLVDVIDELSKAHDNRQAELNEDNMFIAQMLTNAMHDMLRSRF